VAEAQSINIDRMGCPPALASPAIASPGSSLGLIVQYPFGIGFGLDTSFIILIDRQTFSGPLIFLLERESLGIGSIAAFHGNQQFAIDFGVPVSNPPKGEIDHFQSVFPFECNVACTL
jgi:hypothetical protein